ncbi:hypothetical protein ACLESO_48310 [Pyxidicoccus sp. 3LG]
MEDFAPRSGWFASHVALSLVMVAVHGCVGAPTATIVTGGIEPRQIHFVTVIQAEPQKVGGWQAACIHIRITRSGTEESILCRFGIEMPVQNSDGPVSVPLAQRVTADRINESAHQVLGPATPASPLGMLCEALKSALAPKMAASLAGAMMTYRCHPQSLPVEFGDLLL